MPSLSLILTALLCTCLPLQGQQAQPSQNQQVPHSLHVTVHDSAQQPVAQAHITVKANGVTVWSGKTNEKGEASISQLPARH